MTASAPALSSDADPPKNAAPARNAEDAAPDRPVRRAALGSDHDGFRRLKIALHWAMLALVLSVWLGGGTVVLALAAVGSAAFAGLYALQGLSHGPGPKLWGLLRPLHRWQHRLIYVMLMAFAVICIAGLFGRGDALRHGFSGWFVAVGTLHGLFHLWRHTALGDGALRRMTPRRLHRYL